MKTLSICIADNDTIRAETIKETLIDENYDAVSCKTEVQALKAVVENKYDIVFFSPDVSIDPFNFVSKVKSFSPDSHIVVINSVSQNVDIPPLVFAELGIKHYIDTPITSMNYILDKVHLIESEIISQEDRANILISILEEAKAFARGDKKSGTSDAKALIKNASVLSNVFNPTAVEEGKIKGDLKEFSYFEAVRILGTMHSEGMLELTSETDRALFIIKNGAVVSAFISPGVRGIKAFLRVAQWEQGHFNFRNKITVSYGVEHDIAYIELIRLCAIAKKAREWFVRFKNNLPAKNLELQMNTKIAGKNIALTPQELDTLMTVIEHYKVSEILNYNNNVDIDIFESLISLRKKGIIEVRV